MRRLLPSMLAVALVAGAAPARAEEPEGVPPRLPARIGVMPTIGVGIARVGNASPFPGFIGLTTLGGEVHAEVPPFGGFARFQFHSSGPDGLWTAPSFALGGTYRLYGDGVERIGLLARAGFVYERWHATTGNCPVDLFVPTNCKAITAPAPSGVLLNETPIVTVTSDNFGLFAGARAEMPISLFYLAVDAEAGGLVDVSGPAPGTVLHLRLALTVAFRDLRKKEVDPNAPPPTPRLQRRRN